MNKNITEIRVKYADTESFGFVYYGRYMEWLESARTELLRSNNISFKELEQKGLFAPAQLQN